VTYRTVLSRDFCVLHGKILYIAISYLKMLGPLAYAGYTAVSRDTRCSMLGNEGSHSPCLYQLYTNHAYDPSYRIIGALKRVK